MQAVCRMYFLGTRESVPEIREKFETAWGRSLSARPGIAASELRIRPWKEASGLHI